jgi:hypothetical protein
MSIDWMYRANASIVARGDRIRDCVFLSKEISAAVGLTVFIFSRTARHR